MMVSFENDESESKATFQGVANVGNRPTVEGKSLLLEVNIFDFTADIYGKEIEVQFISKLRDELEFESIDALQEQITKDVDQAIEIHQNISK